MVQIFLNLLFGILAPLKLPIKLPNNRPLQGISLELVFRDISSKRINHFMFNLFWGNRIEEIFIGDLLWIFWHHLFDLYFAIREEEFVELLSAGHPQLLKIIGEMSFEFEVDLKAPAVLFISFEWLQQLFNNIFNIFYVWFGQTRISLFECSEDDWITLFEHEVNAIDGIHRTFGLGFGDCTLLCSHFLSLLST